MPQIVNTNIMTLNAQRNLNRSQNELSVAVQRLSSGLRINSAKDDAAGLAISARMTVQVSGLSVSIRNANDGISIAQTAEGAMDEMVRALTRANDLAIQAASYNTSADRESLNQEVSQLIDEMSRIVNQTRYNGERILTGGFTADIQVGVQVNETINVNVGNLSPSGLGVASNYASVSALSDAALAEQIRNQFESALAATDTIQGSGTATQIGTAFTANVGLAQDKIAALNDISASTGVTAFGFGNAAVGASDVTDANLAATAVGAGELQINGIQIDGATGLTALAANINQVSGQTGVTAVIDNDAAADDNRLVLLNRNGAAVSVSVNSANAAAVTGFASGVTNVDAGANGAIVLNDDLGTGTVTFNSAGAKESLTGDEAAGTTASLTDASVSAQTVNTAGSANLAILAFASAIDDINSDRAVLGAKLNRLEGTIRNLENVRENISAARSRIQDADFAMETAKLTRAQILQQAGVAMVSQANSLPQTVLGLLQ